MRVSIIVTDDDGNTFVGDADLTATASSKAARAGRKRASHVNANPSPVVSFSSPIRAFVKEHARDMGGPQKFGLLVAYVSKGNTHKQVPLAEIRKQWNQMKPLLKGRFNVAYTTRAKEQGWVDSPARGMYLLLPGWKGIFNA